MGRLLYASVTIMALASPGCGLIPVPYVADVSGPITGLRVVDMHSSEDIAGASASFCAGVAQTNWMRSWPPELFATAESEKEDASEDGILADETSGVFPVTKRRGLGFVRPFGIGPLGWALHNPPIGVVRVTAPGYPEALLLYYSGAPPEPGWTATAAILPESPVPEEIQPNGEALPPEAVRCELAADGTLWFYLRREAAVPLAESMARRR